MRFNHQTLKSPAGPLHLVGTNVHVHAIVFEKQWPNVKKRFADLGKTETPVLKKTKRQLCEYFLGKRQSFDLPLHLHGTDFQKKVWKLLARIPFGQTRTYKQQALMVKSPNASRAVGRANGLNLLCIVLPCHRVIGSNGALTGYAGGLQAKKFLLALER